MVNATRTGKEAIAWGNTVHKGYVGLCLRFVRHAFGVGNLYPTAAKSWEMAKKKHKTSDPMSIPAGVPVHIYVPNLPPGHVALSVGNGKMRTNLSWKGTVETVDIAWYVGLKRGSKLLGWTEDLNGVTVYKKPAGSNNKPDHSTGGKKKQYVTLQKTVSRWAIYRLKTTPIAKNAFAYLNPQKFNGLTYEILGWTVKGQVAKIKTSQFGEVQIFIGTGTGAKVFTK